MNRPHTLAAAWNMEAYGRGVTDATPGYEDAQNLFYAGAAAMLSMIAAAGPDKVMLVAFMQTMQAELKEYLDSLAP